jgi:aspartate aminotransferase
VRATEVSRRASELQSSPTRGLAPLAKRAEQDGKRIFRLNVGQPDLPTPPVFLSGIRSKLEGQVAYSPVEGFPEALAAWRAYYRDLGIPLRPDEMIVTTGASGALSFSMKAVLDVGDELLLFEPFFPNYVGHAALNGVVPVAVTTRAQSAFHLPDQEEVEAAITPKTKAILYGSPANPTGTIYRESELRTLVDIATRHGLFIIADEIYREYAYDAPALSLMSIPETRDCAIIVDSVSKRVCACGARVGLLASRNEEVIEVVRKIAQTSLPPPTLGQYGFASFISDPEYPSVLAEITSTFRARRDAAVDALQQIQTVSCERPAGAFFIVVMLPVLDSDSFARWLLTDYDLNGETVHVTPMAGFYLSPDRGRDEVRIAYVLEEDELRHAIHILATGLEEYCRLYPDACL